ncbi:hypothetical protein ACT6NV_12710 [Robiginitalea sp. IMCC44478]|uniref:hypothetical protein n=1 Tax=Robiginitalea sp. IMCC44478 TaxID=3459122 RepID=UPI004042F846
MNRIQFRSFNFFLLSSLLLLATSFDTPFRETHVYIASDSEMVISGSTNVNTFHCRYSVTELDNPLSVYYEEGANRYTFRNTRLELSSNCFDCGGNAINRDFQELLKSDIYPEVVLELLYVEKPSDNLNTYKVGVSVMLAGQCRTYETLVFCDQTGSLCIEGDLNVCFSDFNLEPPSKVMGLIKVNDQLTVNLKLKIRQAQSQS